LYFWLLASWFAFPWREASAGDHFLCLISFFGSLGYASQIRGSARGEGVAKLMRDHYDSLILPELSMFNWDLDCFGGHITVELN
jgi:hypothetical protein